MSFSHSMALRAARKILADEDPTAWDTNVYFICVALNTVRYSGCGVPYEVWRDLKDYIRDLLGSCGHLDDWVKSRCPEAIRMEHTDINEFRRRMRDTRLAWIDWMVARLEEQGR